MELEGKRVALLVEDMYHEHEFWIPYYRMKEAGAKVTVVGTGAKEYYSKIGLPNKVLVANIATFWSGEAASPQTGNDRENKIAGRMNCFAIRQE